MIMLSLYLRVYGILALSHIGIHVVLGHIHHLRRRPRTALVNLPSASVVVPVYNEDPQLLAGCLASLAAQNHPAMHVVVIDDGSPNLAELEPVYSRFSTRPGWTVLRLTRNVGKRAAQRVGFDVATTDVVVTVDSDTTLDDVDALATLTRSFLRRRVAAVTGAVGVSNSSTNVLTRLTALRYWMAFHQERAAQSLFGVMLCCSGPFAAYRLSVVKDVLDDYVGQRFLGQRCTFGDDRHLTNLVLSRGHQAIFDPEARAMTHVPDAWPGFIRQQVRWNKSFYRELLWSLRFAHRRNPYLALELGLQTLLPFMLIGAVVSVAVRSLSAPRVAATYGLIVLGIALLRASYGAVRTRRIGFFLFSAYGFIHVALLLPVRMYALGTLGRTHWGTRGMHGPVDAPDAPAQVLKAQPLEDVPRQRTGGATVVTVGDTRAARTAVPPDEPVPVLRDLLPTLERGPLGRWRPARSASTVVMVPRQVTAGRAPDLTWAPLPAMQVV
jgi:hyaluronan synthase